MTWIDNPHPDIELGVPRTGLSYSMAVPSGGVSPDTGLVLYIHGYAARYDDPYSLKLNQYLADQYNCIAACVDYHGASAQTPVLTPSPDFFLNLKEHHGVELTAPAGMNPMGIVNIALELMADHGITDLHPSCFLMKGMDGYMNFGVLPALDNLQVAWSLINRFSINKQRLFVLGTSYGGYIALLMAKMAPNTFRLVIDNSGFSGPDEDMACILGVSKKIGRVNVTVCSPICFNRDPGSPHYFSMPRRLIRTIPNEHHYSIASDTVLYSYHSTEDYRARTDSKIKTAELLRRFRNHDLRLIRECDLDGRIFKTMDHGMEASMRGLFELSYERWLSESRALPDFTDFDTGTVNRLPCGESDYVASFSPDYGVRLHIENHAD